MRVRDRAGRRGDDEERDEDRALDHSKFHRRRPRVRFPQEIADAKLLKAAVVRVPRSVYAAVPGRNKYRPSQRSPIPNLTLAGCFTSQKFLGSMEGAVLAGKLAAEVVAARAVGADAPGLKDVQPEIIAKAEAAAPKKPVGCRGDTAIAFGGGYTFDQLVKRELQDQDDVQFAE